MNLKRAKIFCENHKPTSITAPQQGQEYKGGVIQVVTSVTDQILANRKVICFGF